MRDVTIDVDRSDERPEDRVGMAPGCPTGTMTKKQAKHWVRDNVPGTRYRGVNYYFDANGTRVKRAGFARFGVAG